MKRELRQTVDLVTGVVISERYYQNGRLHRDEQEGPAVIMRDAANEVCAERYYLFGRMHRVNGPAYLNKSETGVVVDEQYFLNGGWHRVEGPAVIGRMHANGKVNREEYFYRNLQHRDPEQGPAAWVIFEGQNGSWERTEHYYVYGEEFRDPAKGPCFSWYSLETGSILGGRYSDSTEAAPTNPFERSRRKNQLPPHVNLDTKNHTACG